MCVSLLLCAYQVKASTLARDLADTRQSSRIREKKNSHELTDFDQAAKEVYC
jgi:hypothetical protein